MKKIISVLFMGIALMLCSCEPDADQNFEKQTFSGTVSVEYNNEKYDNENIIVDVEEASEGFLTLTIHSIRFVPKMPVTIDVTYPNVPYTKSNDNITFFIDSIVPMMGTTPVERYTSKLLSGIISNKGVLTFSVQIGDYPTSYIGTRTN